MSADFAVLTCNGRMTNDPKTFAVGETEKSVFSVAVNRYFRRKGATESEKRTTFVDCVAWGPNSDKMKKFGKKGAKVSLSGEWETDTYEKDGKVIKRDHLNIRHLSIFTAPSDANSASNENDDVVSLSE